MGRRTGAIKEVKIRLSCKHLSVGGNHEVSVCHYGSVRQLWREEEINLLATVKPTNSPKLWLPSSRVILQASSP